MLVTIAVIVLLVFLLLCAMVARVISVRLSGSNQAPLPAIGRVLKPAPLLFLVIAVLGALLLTAAPAPWSLITVGLTLIYTLWLVFRLAAILKK